MSSGFHCFLVNKMFPLGKSEVKYTVAASIAILELVNILHAGIITVGLTFLIHFFFLFKQLYVS